MMEGGIRHPTTHAVRHPPYRCCPLTFCWLQGHRTPPNPSKNHPHWRQPLQMPRCNGHATRLDCFRVLTQARRPIAMQGWAGRTPVDSILHTPFAHNTDINPPPSLFSVFLSICRCFVRRHFHYLRLPSMHLARLLRDRSAKGAARPHNPRNREAVEPVQARRAEDTHPHKSSSPGLVSKGD